MQNLSWSRSQIAEEIEDTLKFGGLTDDWGKLRVKEEDRKQKTYYLLKFKGGSVKIYGPSFILVNGDVFRSVRDAKRWLQEQFIK